MKLKLTIIFLTLIMINANIRAQIFPLKMSDDLHYLVDQKNIPYPILGRTAWFIISLPKDQYHQFIENSVAKGYNAIEMHIIDHDPRGNNAPYNGDGDLPFTKRLDGKDWSGSLTYTTKENEAPDLTTPNEKYWKYADSFLAYCVSKKIMVFMFPGYLGYDGGNQGWMQELLANGTQKTEAFGAWIANRYKNQKNIIWMLLGDMGNLKGEQKDIEAALIKGLK